MSLSPREHINVIRIVLRRERAMREQVFKANPSKLRSKLGEIDQALESLAALEHLAAQQEAPQGNLFDAPTRG